MAVLVTGCAGYIGSVACKKLVEQGFEVIGLDNLSNGFRENIPEAVNFYEACISDEAKVLKILTKHDIDSVMHFAGYIQVGESVQKPGMYFENNITKNIQFLDSLVKTNKNYNFVFSSSAAVYGNPEEMPITEASRKETINPYGETKLAFENILKFYSQVHKLDYIALRYFNVCGAYGKYGECHDPETHLIPLVLDAAMGKRSDIKIFGTDYPTSDGTAIRDYIHVSDLIDAHILALKTLADKSQSKINRAYNLGYGKGFSVREIIEAVKKVTAKDFTVIETERREGDPAELVADSSALQGELAWKAEKNNIETIVADAYEHRIAFHKNKEAQSLSNV